MFVALSADDPVLAGGTNASPVVPPELEALFTALPNQMLQARSLVLEEQEHTFQVLPLGVPLRVGCQEQHEVYMLPQYWTALSYLLGADWEGQLAAQMAPPLTGIADVSPPNAAEASSSATGAQSAAEAQCTLSTGAHTDEGTLLEGGAREPGVHPRKRLHEALAADAVAAGGHTPAKRSSSGGSGGNASSRGQQAPRYLIVGVAGMWFYLHYPCLQIQPCSLIPGMQVGSVRPMCDDDWLGLSCLCAELRVCVWPPCSLCSCP